MNDKEYTPNDFYQIANKMGITQGQLQRLRSNRLFPLTNQIGLGRGKGKKYFYTEKSIDELKTLIYWRNQRDTKYVLVNLWLLGYSVDTKKFLAIINSIIDNYELWWYRIKEYNDNCDNEIKYVDNRKRHYSKTISSVHRKDYNNFSQWKKMFINVISSKYAFTKSSDLILFLKGINIYNENLNLRDINKEIHEIQKAIHPDNLRKTINDYIIHSPNKSRIDYIFFAPFLEMLLEFPELRNDISNFPVYPFDTVKLRRYGLHRMYRVVSVSSFILINLKQ
jgi:cell division protein FtsL